MGALIGFTRVDPPEEGGSDQGPPRAPIASGPPAWVLGVEVRGEGVFIRFDASHFETWLQRPEVREREQRLLEGFRRWRAARRLPPDDSAFPGALYFAIHSFSHALLREFAIDCGYGAASIRERIYCEVEDGTVAMAGLMLYTAAPDSEGTLGGLVELGRPLNLGRLIGRALTAAALCSSDPLCAEHDPTADRSLHGAACHACLFSAETSCEEGNRFLDRELLVPTYSGSGTTSAFPAIAMIDSAQLDAILQVAGEVSAESARQLAEQLANADTPAEGRARVAERRDRARTRALGGDPRAVGVAGCHGRRARRGIDVSSARARV